MAGSSLTLRHGTRLVFDDGLLVDVTDRTGFSHVALAWEGRALDGLQVSPPPTGGAAVMVRGERLAHLLFGAAHPVFTSAGGSQPVTWMGALDWARPQVIPPIEHPFRVPGGAGTIILNTLALLAGHAGVEALRYAGPYPTHALWQSIEHSFRTTGDEASFTAGALERAARADMSVVAVDFAPAPFERVWVAPAIWVQLRDGVERMLVAGETYARGTGVRRLVAGDAPGEMAAEVWLGGAPYARMAVVGGDGELRASEARVPPPVSPVLGEEVPAPLRAALAELVRELLPAPLAPGAVEILTALPVAWGDAGAAAARDQGDRVIVHAALWDRLAPRGMAAVALALAEALAPAVAARAQARLAALLSAAVAGG